MSAAEEFHPKKDAKRTLVETSDRGATHLILDRFSKILAVMVSVYCRLTLGCRVDREVLGWSFQVYPRVPCRLW